MPHASIRGRGARGGGRSGGRGTSSVTRPPVSQLPASRVSTRSSPAPIPTFGVSTRSSPHGTFQYPTSTHGYRLPPLRVSTRSSLAPTSPPVPTPPPAPISTPTPGSTVPITGVSTGSSTVPPAHDITGSHSIGDSAQTSSQTPSSGTPSCIKITLELGLFVLIK